MTFDDDYVRLLRLEGPPVLLTCKSLELDWPPPTFITISGPLSLEELLDSTDESEPIMQFERVRYSQITDDDRAGMRHVVRGAEYQQLQENHETIH
jgi:hypothetical protein